MAIKRTRITQVNYTKGSNGIKRIARGRKVSISENFSTTSSNTITRKVSKINYWIIVVIETRNSTIDAHSKELLYVAQALASDTTEVLAVVFGASSAKDLQCGADSVLILESEVWQHYNPYAKVKLLEKIIKTEAVSRILFAEDEFGGELARMLAVTTGLSFAGNIDEVSNNAISRVCHNHSKQQNCELPVILALLPKISEGELEYLCEAKPYSLKVTKPKSLEQTSFQIKANEVNLIEADFICSAGNGVSDFTKFHKFAKSLGAAVAGSRVVVDDGKLSRDKQVGATGVSVDASIYLALGISGAIQHLQGITQCAKVIAVNTDVNCSMIKRANLSIIHDVDELMQAVNRELKL